MPTYKIIATCIEHATVLQANNTCVTRGRKLVKACLLRWVKAGSKCIVRDTEVCEGITIIRRRFITIYGDRMAAV